MKRWIFAGKSNKRDLLLYLCKMLAGAGKRVLLIDMTDGGKYRFMVSGNQPALPVTEFNGFDICAGLHSARPESYDYCLYDIETLHFGMLELWEAADSVLWVTSFDRYEVESSAEWFRHLLRRWPELSNLDVRRVYIRTVDSVISEEVILGYLEGLPVNWHAEAIWIPWNEADAAAQMENEHMNTLTIGRISRSYKRALLSLMNDLSGWPRPATKRALRRSEKRRA